VLPLQKAPNTNTFLGFFKIAKFCLLLQITSWTLIYPLEATELSIPSWTYDDMDLVADDLPFVGTSMSFLVNTY
jgi:hypothetical protein